MKRTLAIVLLLTAAASASAQEPDSEPGDVRADSEGPDPGALGTPKPGNAAGALAGIGDTSIEVAMLRASASRDDAEAQFLLGFLYLAGRQLPADDGEALRWFQRAADQGYAPGQFAVGLLYVDGRGVARDDAAGANWMRLAASQRLPPAQFQLGLMAAAGRGMPPDPAEAVRWWRLAADQAMPAARFALGVALMMRWVGVWRRTTPRR